MGGIRYNPALDGLRALSVLAVVGFHARTPGTHGGFVGVDVFFVLSGYLITRVLADNPDLWRFYWRRAKRLVPPLALMLSAYLLVFPVLVPGHHHVRDALLAFFYLSDYSLPLGYGPNYLRHTWSLAVEEHFYLLWPLVFLRWRPGFTVLLAAWVLLTWWRCSQGDWGAAYTRFDTRASGLILGCAIAALPRDRFPAWPGLLALAAMVVFYRFQGPWWHEQGQAWVEVAAAVAVLGKAPVWLSSGSLVYLGKLSYGIYLWHFPLSLWMHGQKYPPSVVLFVTLAFSVLMAALSYHTVEAFLRTSRIRSRYQPAQ